MANHRTDLSNLRILKVFNNYLAPGGEALSIGSMASHLAEGGAIVTQYIRESAEWIGPDAPPKWKQPFLMIRNPGVLADLRRVCERTKPDVCMIHNPVPVISLGVYGLMRELGIPMIRYLQNYRPLSLGGTLRIGGKSLRGDTPFLHLREILAGSWRNRPSTAMLALGYWLNRRRGDMDAVRAWIPLSQETANRFLEGGYPSDRMFVLPHAWDIAPRPQAMPDRGYFLFLGRISQEKGVSFLIHVWRELGTDAPKLLIAGKGPLREALEKNSPANVRWLGHVEGAEKTELLRGCRALLVPSTWDEPLGLVTYEAYEQLRPVIASSQGGLKETVMDRQTGRSLEAGDPSAWLNAIRELISHPETAEQWGLNGRRWLEENTSPELWRARFAEILRKSGVLPKKA